MDLVNIKAPAKINLALNVFGKMEDNYHRVETVMQSISLFDDITIIKSKEPGISLSSNVNYLPLDGKNLAAKAAKLFFEENGSVEDVEIQIVKKIPVGAGLGGGSADAAAVLLGLNMLFEAGFSIELLEKIAKRIGTDVAFCLRRGTYHASGRGDDLKRVVNMPHCTFVVSKPQKSISTATVYAKYDMFSTDNPVDIRSLISSFDSGIRDAIPYMKNMLQSNVLAEVPEMADMLHDLIHYGALTSLMTGSGTAVFGIFTSSKTALDCAKEMRKKYNRCFISLAQPVSSDIHDVSINK